MRTTMLWLRAGLALLFIAVFSLSIHARQDNNIKPDNSIYRYDNPIYKYKTRKEMSDAVVRRVEPVYPPLAKAYIIDGKVNVDVIVNEFGDVVFARAIRGYTVLKDAAVEAVKQWKFKPLKDKKYRMRGTVVVEFSLGYFDRYRDLELYTEQVRQNPDLSDAHYRRGEILHRNLSYQEAIEEFQEAIRLKPDSFMAYKTMGDAYYSPAFDDKALFIEAIEAYKKAVEYNPDYVEAYYNWAASYKWLHRYEEAIPIFFAVSKVRLDLDVLDIAYLNMAECYQKAGKIEEFLEARKNLITVEKEILTVDTDEALMLPYLAYQLGEDLEKHGRYKEALEAYSAIPAVRPGAFEAFMACVKIADMYKKMGQHQESKKAYEQIIGQLNRKIYLDPQNPHGTAKFYYARGIVYEYQEKYFDALKDYKEALRQRTWWQDPKDAIDRVYKKLKEQK